MAKTGYRKKARNSWADEEKRSPILIIMFKIGDLFNFDTNAPQEQGGVHFCWAGCIFSARGASSMILLIHPR